MRMITMRDSSLEHQITITSQVKGQQIEVSCNCRRKLGGKPGPARYIPIETRKLWTAEEAWTAWLDWHALAGVPVEDPRLARLAG